MPKAKIDPGRKTPATAYSTGIESAQPAPTPSLTSSSPSTPGLTPEEEEALRAEFELLSLNELVSHCQQWGVLSAHRGMGKERLIGYLLHPDLGRGASPTDHLRRKIMTAIAEGQVVTDCHGNCFLHSDLKVAQCALSLPRIETL